MKRVYMWFIAAVLFLGACGSQPQESDSTSTVPSDSPPSDYLSEAAQYMEDGRYQEAAEACAKAAEADDGSPEPYVQRARAYSAMIPEGPAADMTDEIRGYYETACADYEAAIERDKTDAAVYEEYARLAEAHGMYNKAADILKQGYEAASSEDLNHKIQDIRDLQTNVSIDPSWNMNDIHTLAYLVQDYSQWTELSKTEHGDFSGLMVWYAFYHGRETADDPLGFSKNCSVYVFDEAEIDSFLKDMMNVSDEKLAIMKTGPEEIDMAGAEYYYHEGKYYVPCAIGFDGIAYHDISVTFDGTFYNIFIDITDSYDNHFIKQVYVQARPKTDAQNRTFLSVCGITSNWSDKTYADRFGNAEEPLCHLDINADNINIRDACSTSGNKIAVTGEYSGYTAYEKTETEGYTWYRIGLDRWIANNGSWIAETAPDSSRLKPKPAQTESAGSEPPYSDDQLCEMAKNYYYQLHGQYPPIVKVDGANGDEVRIHLYEVTGGHTATWDWYTVNRNTGKGTDVLSGTVDLTKS